MRNPLPSKWRIAGAALLLLAGGTAVSWWRDRAAREAFREEILAEVRAREAAKPAPPAVPPEEDAVPLLTKAFGAVDDSALDQAFYGALNGAWTAPPPALETAVAANEEALLLLERAVRLPGMDVPPGTTDSWQVAPYDLARLVQARLLLRARKGDRAGALADATLLAALVGRLSRIPEGGYAFHADYLLDRAFEAFQESALDPSLVPSEARAAIAALPSPGDARAAFDRAVEASYRDRLDAYLLDMLAPDAEERMARARGAPPPSFLDRLEARVRGSPLRPGMEIPLPLSSMRTLRDLAREFREAAAERGPDGLRRLAAFERRRAALGERDPAFEFIRGNLQQLREEVMLEARLGAARTALALRVFESVHGSPAGSLDALVPGLLDAAPVSPFTGEPFAYEITPGGWTLSCPIPPELREKDTMVGLEWKRPE